jgi:hypothetical protein
LGFLFFFFPAFSPLSVRPRMEALQQWGGRALALANTARVTVNESAKGLEAWQVGVLAVAWYIVASYVWGFLFREDEPLFGRIKGVLLAYKKLPFVKGLLQKELDKASADIEKSMVKNVGPVLSEMPAKAMTPEQIKKTLATLAEAANPKQRLLSGKVSGPSTSAATSTRSSPMSCRRPSGSSPGPTPCTRPSSRASARWSPRSSP